VLQCVAVCCSVLQCVAVCCSVLECVAMCCSELECVAMCYSVLECVAVSALWSILTELQMSVAVCKSMLWCVAVRCSVFQFVATWNKSMSKADTCCSVLRCAAVCCSVLQCVAVWCNTLQHTATHCNTLQHTATPSSYVQQMHLTVRGGVLQCVAVCCSVFHFEMSPQVQQMRVVVRGSVLRCTAVRCAVLQCVTIWTESMITADACCSVLQYVCSLLLRATVRCIARHSGKRPRVQQRFIMGNHYGRFPITVDRVLSEAGQGARTHEMMHRQYATSPCPSETTWGAWILTLHYIAGYTDPFLFLFSSSSTSNGPTTALLTTKGFCPGWVAPLSGRVKSSFVGENPK